MSKPPDLNGALTARLRHHYSKEQIAGLSDSLARLQDMGLKIDDIFPDGMPAPDVLVMKTSVPNAGLGQAILQLQQHPELRRDVLRALALLADAGIGFHVICGVSGKNLDDVEELAAVACEQGAAALQLHPMSAAGRARVGMADALLGPDDANLLYVAGMLLSAAYAGWMGVQTDLVHRNCVIARPSMIYAGPDRENEDGAQPADLLGVLVLEPDGALNPVTFGFAPLYGLGDMLEQPLGSMWQPWLDKGYRRLTHLGRQLLADLAVHSSPAVFNPSDMLRLASHRIGATLRRRSAAPVAMMSALTGAATENETEKLVISAW